MLQKIVCFHIQVVFAQLYCYDHRESDDAIVTVSVHVRPIHVSSYNVVIKYRCHKTLRLNMRLCIHVRINPNDICQNSDFFWYLFGSYDMMLSLQLWCSAVQYGSLYGS